LTADTASPVAANTGPLCYGGMQSPDIVGNIRIDQTWGSAQVMGVLHEDNAGQLVSSTAGNGAFRASAIQAISGDSLSALAYA
jgi:hypothetical protein